MKTCRHARQIMNTLGIRPPGNLKDKSEWYRVRKSVPSKELYMQADGNWGPWKTAKRFRTTQQAEQFAEQHTTDPFGFFTYEN